MEKIAYELKDTDYYRHIVNESTLKTSSWSKNKLSISMIVKNEEDWIESALKSIQNIADEIVIVDTGSTDKTVEIAEKFTDKIYKYEWNDSFADARNFVLSKCTGDWILRLDADEIVPAEGILTIWNLLQNNIADLIKFPIHNYLENPNIKGNAEYTLSETVRIFKNLPFIKFNGRVHEEIDESVGKHVDNKELKIIKSPIPIWHFGYIRDADSLKEKYDEYARLSKLDLKEKPKNYKPYFNLAVHYYHRGNHDKAEQYYRKSLELNPKQWMAYHDLGVILYKRAMSTIADELEEARNYFVKAKGHMPDNVDAKYASQINANSANIERTLNGLGRKRSSK